MTVLEVAERKVYGRGCATCSAASLVYSGAELPESYPLQTAPGAPDLTPYRRLTDAKVLDVPVTVALTTGIGSTSTSSAPTMAACREVSGTSTSTTPLRPDSTKTSFTKTPRTERGLFHILGSFLFPKPRGSRRGGKTVDRQPAGAPIVGKQRRRSPIGERKE